jgi:hypothetical protein
VTVLQLSVKLKRIAVSAHARASASSVDALAPIVRLNTRRLELTAQRDSDLSTKDFRIFYGIGINHGALRTTFFRARFVLEPETARMAFVRKIYRLINL